LNLNCDNFILDEFFEVQKYEFNFSFPYFIKRNLCILCFNQFKSNNTGRLMHCRHKIN
jgi:hypothetical protein